MKTRILSSLTVSQKIFFIVFLGSVFGILLGVMSYVGLLKSRETALTQCESVAMEGQQEKIKVAATSLALSLSAGIAGMSDEEQRIDFLRKMIDPIRFEDDKSGYFFIYKGTIVAAHPIQKNMIGQDRAEIADPNGSKYVAKMYEVTKSGGGFVPYAFDKPGVGIQPKLSYAVAIPGSDYWMGTGIYLDNVERKKMETSQTLDESLSVIKAVSLTIAILSIITLIGLGFGIARSISGVLKNAVGELWGGVERLNNASAQIADSGNQIASGASEQAASLEETSSSLEEISSMVRQNADHVSSANDRMRTSQTEIVEVEDIMHRLGEAMEEVNRAGVETKKIIKTIDEIAFQTNILALNAAVEAARAGSAGAGFAIVADEVRSLAMRSAEAAKSTSEMIEENVRRVGETTELSARASEAFALVRGNIDELTRLFESVSTASRQQSEGISQVSQAVHQMDEVVQRNASNAEESASAAQELNNLSTHLKDMTGNLSAIVGIS